MAVNSGYNNGVIFIRSYNFNFQNLYALKEVVAMDLLYSHVVKVTKNENTTNTTVSNLQLREVDLFVSLCYLSRYCLKPNGIQVYKRSCCIFHLLTLLDTKAICDICCNS